jgi:class 3 adenylate cyclase/tetratricopeptide (TPR) repeat protein
MVCGRCGAEQVEGRKFCTKCGASLAAACPACGTPVEPDAAFCGECGTSLTSSSPAPRSPAPSPVADPGERRFVTVLFTDLVGFTTFSEGRDAEDVRSMLTRYFERARTIVERFGGEVDKFIGDAVMAVWGADVAREDDAERGVRAALELVEAVRTLGEEIGVPDLSARAGLTSGETSVGSGGNEKGLVVGDLVNVASRLQSLAPSGTVLVGSGTADLARASIEFEHAGVHEVKGKTEPVEAWKAVRVIAGRKGTGRADGIVPPFVGRAHELRLLKDLLEATGQEGRVRLVSIVGQGGIGKSRLIEELLHHTDGLAEDVYWHQGRSPSYGDGLTFWALGDMVRRRCGISETDDEHRTATRLRTTLAEFVTDADDRAWMEPRLAGLLGIGEMPAGDRLELFAAWRSFFEYVARRGTTVMVFEDLHWADAGMIDFIDEFASRAPAVPILIVTLARPELLDRRSGWGSGKVNTMALHLAPLGDEQVAELVTGTVPGIGSALTAKIVDRAGGIPLYAVEMVRMLVNQGVLVSGEGGFEVVREVDDLDVPDSLHGLVGARIDQLDREDRSLLQDAAVLGYSFLGAGLAALTGLPEREVVDRLDRFVDRSLLTLDRDPRSPERGQYQFVQSLIREVAYGRLTRAERKRRHVLVARYFEVLDVPELAAAVASHYLAAIEAEPDAEDVADLEHGAIDALIEATDRAAALHSHEQVVALCKQGIAIAQDDRQRGELWLRAALSGHALLDKEAMDYGRRAIEAFEHSGTIDDRFRAGRVLATMHNDEYLTTDAIEILAPLVTAHPDEDSEEAARAMAELARSYMFMSRQADALPLLERALTIGERLDLIDLVANSLITRGTGLAGMGRPREGTALLHAGTELAEAHDLTRAIRRGLNNLGFVAQSDSIVDTFRYSRRMLELARRVGDPRELFESLLNQAWWDAAMGDWEGAEAAVAEIDLDMLQRGDQLRTIDKLRFIRMWRGQAAEAEEEHRSIIAEYEQVVGPLQDRQIKANLDLDFASLAFLNGRFADAFDRAFAIDDPRPDSHDLDWAGWAAIALEDGDRLSLVAERLAARPFRGRRIDHMRLTMEAASIALAGDTARAAVMFDEVDRLMEEVASPLDRAVVCALASHLLGSDGDALAATAAELCDRLDLRTVSALFPHIRRVRKQSAQAGA